MPGYQTSNQVAAFDFFLGRLLPDCVVWVPSSNDNDSSARVLPGGSLHLGARSGADPFGRWHDTRYRLLRFCNSYEFLARWRLAFSRLRSVERRLQHLKIPMALLFLARWYEPANVHRLVAEAGLESSYAVMPSALTLGEWLTDLPNPHGNPAANKRYAQLVYRQLAPRLGWKPLPADLVYPEIADVPLFSGPPGGGQTDNLPAATDWHERSRALLDNWTRKQIPEDYVAGAADLVTDVGDRRERQWAGPGDPKTGELARSTTVLVRAPGSARGLEITVARIEQLHAFYPLEIEAAIPSPSGGTRSTTIIPDQGETEHRFHIAIPPDIVPGAAVDVVITPARVTSRNLSTRPESVKLLRIEAIP